jgi:hypothetical protein
VLVSANTRQPIDLLDDREADTFTTWQQWNPSRGRMTEWPTVILPSIN